VIARAAWVWAAVIAAGCGRIGFDANRDGGGGDDDVADAAPPTGLRWVRFYPATAAGSTARVTAAAPDGTGRVAAVVPFEGTVQVDGVDVITTGFGLDTIVTSIERDAATAWSHQLHAGFNCDMRAIEVVPGERVITGGLTSGPLLGDGDPCDLGAGGVQDPIVIDYQPDGTHAATAFLDATGQNAQLWQVRAYPDGSRALFGVYRGNLTIDAMALPTATAESAYIARTAGATTWRYGFTAAADVYPQVLDLHANGDVCITGWFSGTVTILGALLASAGSEDVWIARIGPDGTPRFAASMGSTGADRPYGVIAREDGGCVVAVRYTADLPLGGAAGALVHQGGADAAVIRVDAAGAPTSATTIATAGNDAPAGLAETGGATFVLVQHDGPLTIGATTLTPQATDAVVVQLADAGTAAVAAVLTGTGTINNYGIAARDGEVVVYGTYTGELVIGPYADTQALASGFVMAADLR
jgi:hypothetical protein